MKGDRAYLSHMLECIQRIEQDTEGGRDRFFGSHTIQDAVISGAFTLENLTSEDVTRCHELITTYRNLDLGLADAAVIATAERLNIDRILTVDERDFRALRSRKGRPFVLLPADEK
jgi:predicted nucleic acid-binding protein